MIRYFSVKNYKQFKDKLELDFTKINNYPFNENCIKNNLISKAIIYGKNAVGKTNLCSALGDIRFICRPIYHRNDRYQYKNADVSENELIEFQYSFLLNGTVVDYFYTKKDEFTVVAERLRIGENLIFEYDRMTNKFDFSNVKAVDAQHLNWAKFKNLSEQDDEEVMRPVALRYITHNTLQDEDSTIWQLYIFIQRMMFSFPDSFFPLRFSSSFYPEFDEEELKNFQNFLNEYGVNCELILLDNPEGKKDIYFNYKRPLHFFSNMSSGTAILTKFYFTNIMGILPSFICIDEFDANYHFELSEKIVKLLENQYGCQVVLTTHNTNLLSNSIMRPDCFMILSNGKLTPFFKATTRELREGHNLEKLYINGEFGE